MIPDKRYELLVESLRYLKDKDFLIVFSGKIDNFYKNELINIAKDIGVEDNIKFLDFIPDKDLVALNNLAEVFAYPSVKEDFGIVPVEAMAAGKPVIAYRGGGALETVLEGVTGEFFDRQTPDDIIKVVKKFQSNKYDSRACQTRAKKFSKEKFKRAMKYFVEEVWRRKIDLQ